MDQPVRRNIFHQGESVRFNKIIQEAICAIYSMHVCHLEQSKKLLQTQVQLLTLHRIKIQGI